MEEKKYTGRQIAILTDLHGLLEPAEAILADIERRGITEIYSLGDNIGEGPNPEEVITLLDQKGVISIAGNAEEYVRLGIEPFPYVYGIKEQSSLWTLSKLSEKSKGIILLYPHFIDLMVGGKSIALCHFANDVRWDFRKRSTWTYQAGFDFEGTGERKMTNISDQFLFTNSEEQEREMSRIISEPTIPFDRKKGVIDAQRNPLFDGRPVELYDAIIQGHVHWKLYDPGSTTTFYSIRAAGMAYRQDPKDSASYIIIRERADHKGFDIEEILVTYDREKMITSIINCTNPSERIRKFTRITPDEVGMKL